MGFASPQLAASQENRGFSAALRRLRFSDGTQLMELALVLPVLLLLAVGGVDFAQGFVLKHKLSNAAREGARIAVQQQTLDWGQTNPPTIITVRNAVVEYLSGQDVNVSAISTTASWDGATTWTFAGGGAQIIINRGVAIPSGSGSVIQSTRVVVEYPFSWSFQDVARWVNPSSTVGSSFVLSSDVTMANLF